MTSASPISLKTCGFGLYFFALLLMAVFPPFYLSVSGSTQLVLGVPLPIFYWILIAVLLGVGVTALYLVESANGDIPEDTQP
ncbi:inner membrane protein involved in colicin E2 resistance [Pseudomonas oryzihabitans]